MTFDDLFTDEEWEQIKGKIDAIINGEVSE